MYIQMSYKQSCYLNQIKYEHLQIVTLITYHHITWLATKNLPVIFYPLISIIHRNITRCHLPVHVNSKTPVVTATRWRS
jgi:hypothetical protein